jgi:DNA-directed RNA polymerase subunit RPC12/RpoP
VVTPWLWLVIGLVVLLVAWLVLGFCASFVGPERYSRRLFWMTFLVLGPLGIAAALIMRTIDDNATEVRQVAAGRQRFICPRCHAVNDIPDAHTNYDCWRCGEHRKVKPKATAAAKKA